MKIIKIIFYIIIISLSIIKPSIGDDFNNWLISFKEYALKQGVSKKTLDETMSKVKFLPNVIKYDRYQPEFYEDTKTYISKRTGNKKIISGSKLYNANSKIIDDISNEFSVDRNLLLSLMGIETNFGNYLGKMDIISSLATLSFDKRRSEFFTSELITLLILFDKGVVNQNNYLGSWAGA